MNLENKKVLITGGAGFVGSHIVDCLLRENVAEIIILDILSRGDLRNLEEAMRNERPKITLLKLDINDPQALESLFQQKAPDLVFHQAAMRITQCAEEPKKAFEVMAQGTFNVLEAAVHAEVKKIVFASSAAVYGMADLFPTPESHHPYHNRTLYGACKAFNESLLRSYHEMFGMDYVVLRYFNIYGPRMAIFGNHTEVLVRWVERIAAGERPLIFGDGNQTMDFVHVKDVARANLLAAAHEVTDEVFNIASGQETSLKELAEVLLQVMGSSLKPEYRPERKVNPVPRRIADMTKAKKLLGFEAQISLESGICEFVDWWRKEKMLREKAGKNYVGVD